MSLIQDALKRKSEEQAETAALAPATANGTVSGRSPETEAKSPQPLLIVLISLLTAIVLAALSGLAFYLIRMPPPAAAVPASGGSPAAAAAPEESPSVPPTSSPVVETSEELRPPPPAPAHDIPAQEIRNPWPELKLTGIASGGNQRIAIINGKMLTPGRTIEAVTVREVHEGRVVVEFQGERRTLHVNE